MLPASAMSNNYKVAKCKTLIYEPDGRNGVWVKYKINRFQEFVIAGYTAGNLFAPELISKSGKPKRRGNELAIFHFL